MPFRQPPSRGPSGLRNARDRQHAASSGNLAVIAEHGVTIASFTIATALPSRRPSRDARPHTHDGLTVSLHPPPTSPRGTQQTPPHQPRLFRLPRLQSTAPTPTTNPPIPSPTNRYFPDIRATSHPPAAPAVNQGHSERSCQCARPGAKPWKLSLDDGEVGETTTDCDPELRY